MDFVQLDGKFDSSSLSAQSSIQTDSISLSLSSSASSSHGPPLVISNPECRPSLICRYPAKGMATEPRSKWAFPRTWLTRFRLQVTSRAPKLSHHPRLPMPFDSLVSPYVALDHHLPTMQCPSSTSVLLDLSRKISPRPRGDRLNTILSMSHPWHARISFSR